MTVLGNVEYSLKLKLKKENKASENKLSRKEIASEAKSRSLKMLEIMSLTEHKDKKPTELSGGQQQRVAIARTLVLNPDIILFDEPMSALDVATRLALRAEIKKIQADFGTTMIYITHDQEEAFAMSDRIMVMEEANIVQLDAPENIIKNPSNDYVREFVINNLKTKIDSLIKYTGSNQGDKT
jgi:ABC-type Fe3+/spermidine/putrescine transport system ATPase subunit